MDGCSNCRKEGPSGQGENGFSLVEIAIAIAVMAIGLVAILGLFGHSLKGSRDSTIDTLQALAAKDLLNQVKASSNGLRLTNSWAGNGVYLDYDQKHAVGVSYFDGMGNSVTNYTNSTALTDKATLFALKPVFRMEIHTYNTGLTNLPITNSVPQDTKLVLLYIISVTPGTPAQSYSTQTFQTLVMRP